jgi:hypothetical protein
MATFDTHAIVTQLARAGIETMQAEALTDAFKSLHDTLLAQLATKGDVREAALQLEVKFEALRSEVTLVKWIGTLALGLLLSLVVKAFFKL